MEHAVRERNNHIQFSDFTGDSGIAVPIIVPGPADRPAICRAAPYLRRSGRRNSRVDRNNWAPRVGLPTR